MYLIHKFLNFHVLNAIAQRRYVVVTNGIVLDGNDRRGASAKRHAEIGGERRHFRRTF